jgi:tetratricopeptide (TPR) repeat protein
VASISQQASSDERAHWSFARLLDWHLTRGTRPTGDLDTPGRQWTNKELASRLGNDERTIRNWRSGRNVPPEIVSIERELFGDNLGYASWRAELREAHRSARVSEATQDGTGASEWASIISLPYPSLGSLFKGRDAFLKDLHASLSRGSGRTAIVGSAVYGLGGIGKTRAAVEYAWAHQQDYTALLFVIAEKPEALRRNLAALAGPYRRALAIDETHYGPDHPEVAKLLRNLAGLLERTNRMSEAERLYRRALAIEEASHDPDHPSVALSLNNLAAFLSETNRLSEAEPLLQRALAIFEVSYGPDHSHVAAGLGNLAELLALSDRVSEAEPVCQRALAIEEASYGPDHPNVARRLNNLAELLRATNRLSEAAPMYRRALTILAQFTRMMGHQHPIIETVRDNFVEALRESGRTEAEIKAVLLSVFEDGPQPPP